MNILFPIKDTIDSRRSTRSYKMIGVDNAIMESIIDFAKTMQVPFDHGVEIKFFHAAPTKSLYPLVQSPPDNIAFIAETDVVSISKVGFVGELLILFVQYNGLATCWFGHYKLAELERLVPHLQSIEQLKESNMGYGYSKGITTGKRAICITPLGYQEDAGLHLLDRIQKNIISYKRRELKKLLENPADYDKLSSDLLYSLDLGRKAPSAANAQMWKFGFEDSFKTITITMPAGYKHFKWEHPNVDIGICACHVWLGLIDKGYTPKVTIVEDLGRAVWRITI